MYMLERIETNSKRTNNVIKSYYNVLKITTGKGHEDAFEFIKKESTFQSGA